MKLWLEGIYNAISQGQLWDSVSINFINKHGTYNVVEYGLWPSLFKNFMIFSHLFYIYRYIYEPIYMCIYISVRSI